jgi:hypothetical protein
MMLEGRPLGPKFVSILRSSLLTDAGAPIEINWKANVYDYGDRILWELKDPIESVHGAFMTGQFKLSRWLSQNDTTDLMIHKFGFCPTSDFLRSRESLRMRQAPCTDETSEEFQVSTRLLVASLVFFTVHKHSAEQKNHVRMQFPFVLMFLVVGGCSWLLVYHIALYMFGFTPKSAFALLSVHRKFRLPRVAPPLFECFNDELTR